MSDLRTFCPECGPNVYIDEDGCCTECGALATGEWVSRIFVRAEAAAVSERDDARRLAEEIACQMLEVEQSGWGEGAPPSRDTLLASWEARIRAFLAERDEETAKKVRSGAGDVVEIFLDARPPGTVDLVYDKLARKIGLPEG